MRTHQLTLFPAAEEQRTRTDKAESDSGRLRNICRTCTSQAETSQTRQINGNSRRTATTTQHDGQDSGTATSRGGVIVSPSRSIPSAHRDTCRSPTSQTRGHSACRDKPCSGTSPEGNRRSDSSQTARASPDIKLRHKPSTIQRCTTDTENLRICTVRSKRTAIRKINGPLSLSGDCSNDNRSDCY